MWRQRRSVNDHSVMYMNIYIYIYDGWITETMKLRFLLFQPTCLTAKVSDIQQFDICNVFQMQALYKAHAVSD